MNTQQESWNIVGTFFGWGWFLATLLQKWFRVKAPYPLLTFLFIGMIGLGMTLIYLLKTASLTHDTLKEMITQSGSWMELVAPGVTTEVRSKWAEYFTKLKNLLFTLLLRRRGISVFAVERYCPAPLVLLQELRAKYLPDNFTGSASIFLTTESENSSLHPEGQNTDPQLLIYAPQPETGRDLQPESRFWLKKVLVTAGGWLGVVLIIAGNILGVC